MNRRSFVGMVAAVTAAAMVPMNVGPRLLRTRLVVGDVREVVQYSINNDALMVRWDICYPHVNGSLMSWGGARRFKQIWCMNDAVAGITRGGELMSERDFDLVYRQPALEQLQVWMDRDGIGVYELESWRLPVPRGIPTVHDWFTAPSLMAGGLS